LLGAVLLPAPVRAHDPSAWGGIYRSRDHGATWFLANEGRFVTAALALAIDPTDPHELLLATDSGLLHSQNGGRDWQIAGEGTMDGGAFAAAFDLDGKRALAATARGLFRRDVGGVWEEIAAPLGALPVRSLVSGTTAGQVFLAGWQELYRSDDWGASWSPAGDGLPDHAVATLVAVPGDRHAVMVVSNGELWASFDGGAAWQPRGNGLPAGRVDTVVLGTGTTGSLWAGGADQVFRSDDLGATWHAFGAPLGERDTTIRGIAVSPDERLTLLTTDRGLYQRGEGAASWELLVENVPVHLEARPLVRAPHDPSTIYAGFSIAPYDSLWRRAAAGGSPFGQLDWIDLGGGLAFLVLVGLGGGMMLGRLGHHYGRNEQDGRVPADARARSRNSARGEGSRAPESARA